MDFLPIAKMQERVNIERSESDTAFFYSSMYKAEFVIKMAVAGMVAAIREDRDRHRYRALYRLVRANGVGEWAEVLDEILLGTSAQFLVPDAREAQRQLTQRLGNDTWQYQVVEFIGQCLSDLGHPVEPIGNRV